MSALEWSVIKEKKTLSVIQSGELYVKVKLKPAKPTKPLPSKPTEEQHYE